MKTGQDTNSAGPLQGIQLQSWPACIKLPWDFTAAELCSHPGFTHLPRPHFISLYAHTVRRPRCALSEEGDVCLWARGVLRARRWNLKRTVWCLDLNGYNLYLVRWLCDLFCKHGFVITNSFSVCQDKFKMLLSIKHNQRQMLPNIHFINWYSHSMFFLLSTTKQ